MAMHSLTEVAINFYTHAQAVELTLPSCPLWGGPLCAGCGGRLGQMQLVCLVVSALSSLEQKTPRPFHASVKERSGGRFWSCTSTAPAVPGRGLGICTPNLACAGGTS